MESVSDRNDEPPMFLQRPSLSRCQDVSHILAGAFRDFLKDNVSEQTVKNLTTSRSKEQRYHEEYVERLDKIQSERQRQLDELAMLEAHIMQAKAAATAAEEQELSHALHECNNYKSLGLPPVKSHLRYTMDVELLKKFSLITPADYVSIQHESTQPPSAPEVPSYARPTRLSLIHTSKELIPDNYFEQPSEIMTFPFSNDFSNLRQKQVHVVYPRVYLKLFWLRVYNLKEVDRKRSIAIQFALNGNRPLEILLLARTVSVQTKSRLASSWRESIKPDERYRERNDLKRLNAKVDYLQNPRNIPPDVYPILTKKSKSKSKKLSLKYQSDVSETCYKSTDVLIPSPSPVIFKEYDAGKVYEMKLEIKNVSSSSRQIRLLPPATKFFSIGQGQYPGEHGVIAPGMNCSFLVRFAPDSLTDFVDKIQIKTQLNDLLDVELLGNRKPPQLTIPTVLDCGYCLVGGSKTITFNYSNVGGPGRFCVFHKSEWPSPSWNWSFEEHRDVVMDPFCLKPSIFEVLEGHDVSIQLTFEPTSAKFYKHDIVIVCDNRQVKEHTVQGVAQTARVEFTSVDGGVSQPVIGESSDPSADFLVRFVHQNPDTMKTKKLVLKNTSNVILPFKWMMSKPCMKQSRNHIDTVDEFSAFKITPSSGEFPPDSCFDFQVYSSPKQIGEFHSVAHLVLKKVPILNQMKNITKQEQDLTAMKIGLKISSVPFKVMTVPPLFVVPGRISVGKNYKYQVKLKNNSVSEVKYEWESSSVVDIQPKSGFLEVDKEETLELNIFGREPGVYEKTLQCNIDHVMKPVYLHVMANFEGPLVRIENAIIDFGLVRFSSSCLRTVTLVNLSEIPAVWTMREALPYNLIDVDEGYNEMPSEIQFDPPNGKLEAFQKLDVQAVFTPLTCRVVRSIIECNVTGSPPRYIQATAIVQKPEICLTFSNVLLKEVYVNVPVMKEIELENKTLLSSNITWKECIGVDSHFCTVKFNPSSCTIGPRERKTFNVSFTSCKEGPLEDAAVKCEVEEMEKPLFLSFSGTVSGLEVQYWTETIKTEQQFNDTTGEEEDGLCLNYGKVVLGNMVKVLLFLKNQTAISTKFNISVEHFTAARTPTPPSESSSKKNSYRASQGALVKSANIADPFSRTPSKALADYCRAVLSDGRGVAFVCRPSCGELLPFQECIVDVVAYSDMWGEYKDHLLCKIDGLQEKRIPILLNVEGCPLNFQMSKEISPIVRFGSHVSGTSTVERSLRVNNTSPCDIRLDWEVYNIEEDDNQLIDLIIDVGDPFPKMHDGKEIVSDKLINTGLPLITVNMREHKGRHDNTSFSVEKTQMIVPARKYCDMKVIFSPKSNVVSDVFLSSFFLGFINLDEKNEIENDNVKRRTARDKEPFRLNMTASIKPATLSIVNEDEMKGFHGCSSDLLKTTDGVNFDAMKDVYKTSHYTLSNTSQATISFQVLVERPFTIMDISAPPSACPGRKIIAGIAITLKPRKNIQIAVGFCLSHEMLCKETRAKDVVESEQNGLSPVLEIKKELQIIFTNQTSQTIPLVSTISLPHILVSEERVDFGVCLVGQPKEMKVKLTNYGRSATFWYTEKDDRYPSESREVFDVQPSQGFLEGHLSNISKNNVLLELTFVARSRVEYECMLIFKGLLHEPHRFLLLNARGSYDGGHEDLVSAPTI
ncbi:deleted in lung and esophageal cancer protein 1-like [Xenia sp. Carnegie-2017]|uniref:deleted in lung and esophageal cancer protein 1-like n=1 Tax=Xenia sp. Carnegie-2017 TaxID=2897299 RepID=UPI001F049604|nr:deleted in lung and esophageal cancer protein 1-like [Xenia sp. Carnegie-2017]